MTRKNDAELRRLLDEGAEHAEATKDDPIPDSALALATRPNRDKVGDVLAAAQPG